MENYYLLLKVEQSASEDEIRNALQREQRSLVDLANAQDVSRQMEAQQQVKLLDEAELVLLDAARRRDYDARLANHASNHNSQDTSDLPGTDTAVEQVRQLLDSGRVADAVDIAQKTVAADASNAEAWSVLGLAYSQFGEPEKAIQAQKRAIDLRPNEGLYHFALGNVYESSEQWQLALQCYERACAIDDSVLMYLASRGVVLVKTEQYAEGIDILQYCVEKEPDNSSYKWFLATAYAESAHLGWTEVPTATDLLEPGTYATSLYQVQVAQEAVGKAQSLGVDDPELVANVNLLRADIDSMTKRKFIGNWKAAALVAIVGIFTLSQSKVVPGILMLAVVILYVASTYIPMYMINRQLVLGKEFNEFGWLLRVSSLGKHTEQGWITTALSFFVICLIIITFPLVTLYNLYRYQGDTIRTWLTSSKNKDRFSELMARAQSASRSAADAARGAADAAKGAVQNLVPATKPGDTSQSGSSGAESRAASSDAQGAATKSTGVFLGKTQDGAKSAGSSKPPSADAERVVRDPSQNTLTNLLSSKAVRLGLVSFLVVAGALILFSQFRTENKSPPAHTETKASPAQKTNAEPPLPRLARPSDRPVGSPQQVQTPPSPPVQQTYVVPSMPRVARPSDTAMNSPQQVQSPPSYPVSAEPTAVSTESAGISKLVNANVEQGTLCLKQKQFECAIARAETILQLEPGNRTALALLRDSKSAQKKAFRASELR